MNVLSDVSIDVQAPAGKPFSVSYFAFFSLDSLVSLEVLVVNRRKASEQAN